MDYISINLLFLNVQEKMTKRLRVRDVGKGKNEIKKLRNPDPEPAHRGIEGTFV